MSTPRRGQDWLSTTLRELRKAAGLSGMTAAAHIGKSQRRISDIETGRRVPREDEVKALAALYHAGARVRRELGQAVRDLEAEPAKARVVMSRGAWKMQQRIGSIEARSARIRAFHCAIVLGLAQTPAYARAVFSQDGDLTGDALDRCVAERISRQDILNTGRDVTLLMTEGALRWQAVNPAVMVEQLDHLAELSHRPGVRLGVIPWTTPANVFPLHGFTVFDSRAVTVGTRVATAFLTDPPDVADHEKLFGELEALGAWDNAAREHIRRIAGEYRTLQG